MGKVSFTCVSCLLRRPNLVSYEGQLIHLEGVWLLLQISNELSCGIGIWPVLSEQSGIEAREIGFNACKMVVFRG
jgi:hypothetical protein